jgi:hypothetical protein
MRLEGGEQMDRKEEGGEQLDKREEGGEQLDRRQEGWVSCRTGGKREVGRWS